MPQREGGVARRSKKEGQDSRFLFLTFLYNGGHLSHPLQNQHHQLHVLHKGMDGFMFMEAAILLLRTSWQADESQRTLLHLLLKCNSQEIIQAINYSQTLSLLQAEWS